MTADSARVRGRRVTFCPTKRQHSTLLPRGGHLASPWLFSKLAIPPVARSSASSIWTRLAGCPPCGVLELKYSFASPGRAEEGQGQSQRQHRSRTVRAAKSAAFLHTSFDRRRWSIDQKSDKMSGPPRKGKNRVPLYALAKVASVAAGVQFGWALQLSLLTPYVQELGIPHQWASLIWLCGPISGMIVQPIVGHYSDQSESKWGRRRPFIFTGASLVVVAVLTIAFSADIGRLFGDTQANKTWAIVVFVIGFWLLDLANNTLQGPCRALLADLTGAILFPSPLNLRALPLCCRGPFAKLCSSYRWEFCDLQARISAETEEQMPSSRSSWRSVMCWDLPLGPLKGGTKCSPSLSLTLATLPVPT